MDRITYSVSTFDPRNNGHIHLTPLSGDGAIGDGAWQRLAGDISTERTLIHYPGEVLSKRWELGYAAASVTDGRIVSYVCLGPVYSAQNRGAFAETLGVSPAAMPEIDVYEFTTAWTAPEWRRFGISSQMRPALLERFFQAQALGASGMAGLASPVLAKLGWKIVGWNQLPFTSSLTGIPREGFTAAALTGWRPPQGLKRYEGGHIPLENQTHSWKDYSYFWTSDVALAEELDHSLGGLVQGDLCRWRRAVVEVFRAPEELHRLAFLD